MIKPASLPLLVLLGTLPAAIHADTSYTINNTTADAFLAAGSAGNPAGSDLTSLNFGGAGTLAIASASSTKGEFDSLIKFNLAGAVSQFDTTYGAGQWEITGLTLQLASNFGVQGSQPNNNIFNKINAGSFGIQWLSYDGWTEGSGGGTGSPGFPGNSAVSLDSKPTLFSGAHHSLGTFTYTPPGNNIYASYALALNSGLLADAAGGGDVSLYFFAADDDVSYLFNARSFASNHPELTISVTSVPEPAYWAAASFSLVAFAVLRRRL
ncbi:MAG TPA: hypothetical protein VMF06_18855 [Candidatus Limnocylindria bacterium]|jgi:hypothetical protein|nr:hypothetical protein [Candidatus Limnocylindria bacterium]